MKKIIGIDLGTTNSAVSYLDDMGTPSMIHNDDGGNITPSVVCFESEYKSIIGEQAKRTLGFDKHTFAFFKRHMGTDKTYECFSKKITPTFLSSLILKKMYLEAKNKLQDIAEAVVTVPANFTNQAREATLEAGKKSGLNIKYIINEPTAAALYYSYKSGEELSGNYAVYDLGGGTFDISIIKSEGKEVEILSSEGVSRLGGKDFDDKLIEIVSSKFKEKTGKELKSDDYTYYDAENDKKSLSKRDSITISIGRGIDRAQISITREEFEKSISTLVAQTEMLCESALEQANIDASEVQNVFLVGGSTRTPLIQKSVEKVFKRKPVSFHNPDEVISLGASVYCGYKTDKKNLNVIQKASIQNIKIREITNHYFGTTILDVNQDTNEPSLINSILIKKGNKIPCSKSNVYHTVSDNQLSINCEVTQSSSEEKDPKFVNIIWKGQLELPEGRPAGQEVRVTFSYDENQIMKCSFLDVNSSKEKSIDLNMKKQDSSEEDDEIGKFFVA